MEPPESLVLLARIERLERRNRRLTTALVLGASALALLGWQRAEPSTLRVQRLEVIDERGVPLVVLAPDRGGAGGAVTLRDRNGERRAWFTASENSAALTLNSEGKGGISDSTLGLAVGPRSARLNVLSQGGASLSAGIQDNRPKVELYGSNGATLFTAPWK